MQAIERTGLDYSYDGDTLVNPNGEQVSLDLYYSAGQDTEQLTAEFIAQEFSNNLGIEVTPEGIERLRFSDQYWTAEPEGGSDTWLGEEYTWEAPNQWNPGPRSVGQNENWDMSIMYSLSTYPRKPLNTDVFFDGPTTFYNPVGYYPEFDAKSLWADVQNAESIEEMQTAFSEMFIKLAEDQPYVMTVFEDDLVGYNSDLVGPQNSFSNEWDFPAWHYGAPTIADYANNDGIVDGEGFNDALDDLIKNRIGGSLFNDVLDAFISGDPVT